MWANTPYSVRDNAASRQSLHLSPLIQHPPFSSQLTTTMCYFEQTRWQCGYWKWGNFRQQCNKEYRTGETCGLKLVYDTNYMPGNCKLCDQIEKKERRYNKMAQDVERWRREGNRKATIEKTEYDMEEVRMAIEKIWGEHQEKLRTIG